MLLAAPGSPAPQSALEVRYHSMWPPPHTTRRIHAVRAKVIASWLHFYLGQKRYKWFAFCRSDVRHRCSTLQGSRAPRHLSVK